MKADHRGCIRNGVQQLKHEGTRHHGITATVAKTFVWNMNIYVWHPQVYKLGVPYSLRSRITISDVPKATVAQIAHHALEHCSVADLSEGY